MKIDTEMLRNDLVKYCRAAAGIGLPLPEGPADAAETAREDELVSMAADLGWDLGKYIL